MDMVAEMRTWIAECHDSADLLHRRSRKVSCCQMCYLCALGVSAYDDLGVWALAEGLCHK